MATINETINDIDDLKRVLESAASGTDIILDPNKTIRCNSDVPIRVRAKNIRVIGFGPAFGQKGFNPKSPRDGRANIKGDGKLTFQSSNKLQIIGFFFRVRFVMDDCNDCSVKYSDFHYDTIPENEDRVHVFILRDGARNQIYSCKFHDKNTEGAFLIIRDKNGRDTKTIENVVEQCEFCDHRFNADGGESIVIGNSDQKLHNLKTLVTRCNFHDLNADPETISIKSCGNRIENCVHEHNASSFVVRHGHTNTIKGCIFRGSGGIRLYGKDNKIQDNFFLSNNSRDYRPITLANGKKRNEEDGNASYTQVRNNEITGNKFVNCDRCVRWGKDPDGGGEFKPEMCKFQDNTIIAEGSASSIVLEFLDGGRVWAFDERGNRVPKRDNKFENNIVYGNIQYYRDPDNRLADKEEEILERSYKAKTKRPIFEIPDVLGKARGRKEQRIESSLQR